MKNKKGFTLVEMLAVVAILIIVIAIITPKIFTQFKHAEKVTDQEQINTLIETARIYMNQNTNLLPGENKTYAISLNELKESGLIQAKKILKPSTKQELTGCVLVQYENNKYKYTYNENKLICQLINQLVTSGDGLYKSETEPGRLIYRGTDPDNRIFLKEDGTNDTLYRIVSYEKDGTIKVVRDEKLFNKEWDEGGVRKTEGTNNTYCTSSNGCNVWGSGANTLYNGSSLGDNFHYVYYPSPTDIYLSNGASGKVETESTLNKYLNDGSWTGLSNLESYIDTHSWNVGGVYYTSGDKGIIKEKEEERQLNWLGKVGLLNITEYLEASLNPTCTSVRSNYSSGSNSTCKETNWTYKNYHQWSLSPNSNSRQSVWCIYSSGSFADNSARDDSIGVRPAFYLKSSVVLTGEGTEANPYTITSY